MIRNEQIEKLLKKAKANWIILKKSSLLDNKLQNKSAILYL
jgi:hypothetical protein